MSSFFTSLKKYGLGKGLKMYLYLKIKRKKELSIPNIKHKVRLRPGTNDYSVVKQIFTRGEYEVDYESLIGYPEVIIDAGAHIGLSAVFFANRFPDSKIIAIEPSKENYRLLVDNTNRYPNIIPCNFALWNSRTSVNVVESGYGEWAYMVEEANNRNKSTMTQGISMSDLIKEYKIGSIDILKMDIEGSEKEIFSDVSTFWLKKTKLIAIELHDRLRPGSKMAFLDAMKQYTFSRILKNKENIFYMNDRYKVGE